MIPIILVCCILTLPALQVSGSWSSVLRVGHLLNHASAQQTSSHRSSERHLASKGGRYAHSCNWDAVREEVLHEELEGLPKCTSILHAMEHGSREDVDTPFMPGGHCGYRWYTATEACDV
eukprot:CAMPEP_0202916778 /NCGR_PEP_ID=MMETSP1392-20130828/69413_1 /ASSEMBLY_ACC=CAM_ASM_000868 /TAXON_ID=225041 /ORGANISM="Chlamydomonas chlamydogama, Strain SAG 11-48b" /LENGTH=119 /DNA_ID=CAMNT_0049609317 /DNA_START=59 /DNA_END=415 /DNA_ORIENTATION=+